MAGKPVPACSGIIRDAPRSPTRTTRATRCRERRRHTFVRGRNGKTNKAKATTAPICMPICATDQTGFAGDCTDGAWVGANGGGLGGFAGAVVAGGGGSGGGDAA